MFNEPKFREIVLPLSGPMIEVSLKRSFTKHTCLSHDKPITVLLYYRITSTRLMRTIILKIKLIFVKG